MTRRLLLARHASIKKDLIGCYWGRTDVSLDAQPAQEMELLAELIERYRPGVCFSSPLQRALHTAKAIAPGLKIEQDHDLREIDFGDWEGKTFEEIKATQPNQVERWASFHPDFGFPQGERISDFFARAHRAANRLASHAAEVVLGVSHGGVIRAILCDLLGLAPEHYVVFEVQTASLVVIDLFGRRGVLVELSNWKDMK